MDEPPELVPIEEVEVEEDVRKTRGSVARVAVSDGLPPSQKFPTRTTTSQSQKQSNNVDDNLRFYPCAPQIPVRIMQNDLKGLISSYKPYRLPPPFPSASASNNNNKDQNDHLHSSHIVDSPPYSSPSSTVTTSWGPREALKSSYGRENEEESNPIPSKKGLPPVEQEENTQFYFQDHLQTAKGGEKNQYQTKKGNDGVIVVPPAPSPSPPPERKYLPSRFHQNVPLVPHRRKFGNEAKSALAGGLNTRHRPPSPHHPDGTDLRPAPSLPQHPSHPYPPNVPTAYSTDSRHAPQSHIHYHMIYPAGQPPHQQHGSQMFGSPDLQPLPDPYGFYGGGYYGDTVPPNQWSAMNSLYRHYMAQMAPPTTLTQSNPISRHAYFDQPPPNEGPAPEFYHAHQGHASGLPLRPNPLRRNHSSSVADPIHASHLQGFPDQNTPHVHNPSFDETQKPPSEDFADSMMLSLGISPQDPVLSSTLGVASSCLVVHHGDASCGFRYLSVGSLITHLAFVVSERDATFQFPCAFRTCPFASSSLSSLMHHLKEHVRHGLLSNDLAERLVYGHLMDRFTNALTSPALRSELYLFIQTQRQLIVQNGAKISPRPISSRIKHEDIEYCAPVDPIIIDSPESSDVACRSNNPQERDEIDQRSFQKVKDSSRDDFSTSAEAKPKPRRKNYPRVDVKFVGGQSRPGEQRVVLETTDDSFHNLSLSALPLPLPLLRVLLPDSHPLVQKRVTQGSLSSPQFVEGFPNALSPSSLPHWEHARHAEDSKLMEIPFKISPEPYQLGECVIVKRNKEFLSAVVLSVHFRKEVNIFYSLGWVRYTSLKFAAKCRRVLNGEENVFEPNHFELVEIDSKEYAHSLIEYPLRVTLAIPRTLLDSFKIQYMQKYFLKYGPQGRVESNSMGMRVPAKKRKSLANNESVSSTSSRSKRPNLLPCDDDATLEPEEELFEEKDSKDIEPNDEKDLGDGLPLKQTSSSLLDRRGID